MRARELSPASVPGVRIGGSELLLRFFEDAVRLAADRLLVLAPYVDDAAFADDAFRRAWQQLLCTADITVVVRTALAAEVVARRSARRGRNCDLRINPRLHAKVFVACRAGREIGLAGSHNLTGAALHANEEIGVLIGGGTVSELRGLARQLREVAESIARVSARYLLWPDRVGHSRQDASRDNGTYIPCTRVHGCAQGASGGSNSK